MVGAVVLFALAAPFIQGGPSPMVYKQAADKWRADYAEGLLRPEGWLSVAGLFWLKEGTNTVGSAEECEVRLPAHASPPMAGNISRTGDKCRLTAFPGVDLKVNGQPAVSGDLNSDAAEKVDRLAIGGVTFKVIQRGERIGVRLYDPKCKGRTDYHGLHWYPADEKWVVKAKFVPYTTKKTAMITNVLGDTSPVDIPGYLSFTLDGKECKLDAQDEGVLFLNFQDTTSGKSTYGAGRFLYTDKPDKDGNVVIDFNQTTNPPCAYTSFATCPLPPAGNRLDVAVTAGEKKYHG